MGGGGTTTGDGIIRPRGKELTTDLHDWCGVHGREIAWFYSI